MRSTGHSADQARAQTDDHTDGGSAATLEAIGRITGARTARELFGVDQPAREYRRLARLTHPDAAGPADPAGRAAATAAFVRLTTLWRSRAGITLAGYRLSAAAHRGAHANLYDVGDGQLLKLARQPAANPRLEREARALRQLAAEGDPRYLPYVPRLVRTLRHRDEATGVHRQINVLATTTATAPPGSTPATGPPTADPTGTPAGASTDPPTGGPLVSLAEVAQAYPQGVDPRDAAWMWRRLLVALGFAHRAALVHCAVRPEHVLIDPAAHGLVLVGWGSAGPPGGTAERSPRPADPADRPASAGRLDEPRWYPPELSTGVGPGTDVAMAATVLADLIGDRIPGRLRSFADGCRLPRLNQRPDDAWRLLGEFDQVLHELYGPRTFRPFTLPPVADPTSSRPDK